MHSKRIARQHRQSQLSYVPCRMRHFLSALPNGWPRRTSPNRALRRSYERQYPCPKARTSHRIASASEGGRVYLHGACHACDRHIHSPIRIRGTNVRPIRLCLLRSRSNQDRIRLHISFDPCNRAWCLSFWIHATLLWRFSCRATLGSRG